MNDMIGVDGETKPHLKRFYSARYPKTLIPDDRNDQLSFSLIVLTFTYAARVERYIVHLDIS
jgi:hypothetical protein